MITLEQSQALAQEIIAAWEESNKKRRAIRLSYLSELDSD